MTEPRAFAVYRDSLVAPSEPYVVDQPSHVPRYSPHWIGHRLGTVSTPPPDRTVVSTWGPHRVRRLAFLAGHDPVIDRALRRIQPCLLHAHFGPDGMYASATARRLGIPLVVTFHGFDATRPDLVRPSPGARLWQHRRAALFEQAALLVAVSDFVAGCLVALGAPPHKVVRHYVGVDTARFAPIPHDDGDDSGTANVLFVGRLIEAKGVFDLMRAMATVRRALPNATLTVLGEGEMRAEVERLDQQLGLGTRLLGAQSHDEVLTALHRADLLCVPSRTSQLGQREGLGLVFAEAQACGLPVVSCRSGGIPEVVEHGVTGLLTDEGDVDALAAAIIDLLGDQPRRARFGLAARERMVRQFDLQRQSTVLADLYDRVVG